MATALAISASTLAAPALAKSDETTRVDVSPGGTIEFDLQSGGSVTVTGWDKSIAEVTYWQSGRGHSHTVEIERTDRGLLVTAEPEDYEGRSMSLDFEVSVPHDFNVEFDSMGGGLELSELEGRFTGKTMGGGISISDVKGKVRLTTMGGAVDVRDSELDGYIKTMGGEVLLKNVVGDLEASSMGGDVRYVNVRSQDGEVRTPGGISARGLTKDTVAITTMGGSIVVDEAPAGAAVETMGGDIDVANASSFVKAKTMGGDIDIEMGDGWVKATTMAGDIQVDVYEGLGEGKEGVNLVSMAGDITLEIPRDLPVSLDLTISYTKNSRKDYTIDSDWDLDIERSRDWDYDNGTPRKRIHGTATVGSGRYPIKIKTINGNIYLKAVK
jgi:DUF4097 and DUF4098 domain-containing protein YvlB